MSQLALGLMSGTSADGISAALLSFSGHSFKFIGHLTEPFPAPLREKILKRGDLSARELSSLNVELGRQFAHAALRLLKKHHIPPRDVVCIGSHGQTMYHGPRDSVPNTLQIADPATISELTGITVVSHFRQRDMAAGGEGAPLVPFFDQYFYGQGPLRALINIGGIANVTVVGKQVPSALAFDTGPGNCLMDLAVKQATHNQETFDHHGHRAKQGQIDMQTVQAMIEEPYFKRRPPKSTGPELFGEGFLKNHFGTNFESRINDVLATLNYFTCLTIQESFRNFIFPAYPLNEILISGGGVYNKVLRRKLECLFAPIAVRSIEDFGLPALAKEPAAFAFFGFCCIHGKINHLPACTGAKRACVLGSVTKAC